MHRLDAGILRDLWGASEAAVLRGVLTFALLPKNDLAGALAQLLASDPSNPEIIVFESPKELMEAGFEKQLRTSAVVVCEDDEKLRLLSELNSIPWAKLPEVVVAGVGHQRESCGVAEQLEFECAVPSHATGADLVKAHLFDCLKSLGRRGASGLIVELGSFRGGTLLLLRRMIEHLGLAGLSLVGFDTFAGFPPRRRLLDLYSDVRFENHEYEATRGLLERHGVSVVRGDIRETCARLCKETLLLTFFDTDNYSPAADALPVCFEQTVPGGFIVFDHFYTKAAYLDTIGEHVAAAEFFDGRHDYFHLSGTGVFVKLPTKFA